MNRFIKLGSVLTLGAILLSACGEATVEKVDTASTKQADAKPASDKTDKPKEQAKKEPEVFKVGDSVKFNDLVITVNSVKDNAGTDFDKPADGNVYKVLDITVENTGSKEEVISSIANTSMSDSDGYTYNIGLVTFIKNQLDGSVPAGRKLRGQIAFEVPKNAAGLDFIFKNPFSTGQAIWKIK